MGAVPRSLWKTTLGSRLRRNHAIHSASVTMSAVILGLIGQPTTYRLNRSGTMRNAFWMLDELRRAVFVPCQGIQTLQGQSVDIPALQDVAKVRELGHVMVEEDQLQVGRAQERVLSIAKILENRNLPEGELTFHAPTPGTCSCSRAVARRCWTSRS
jgi:hypothetical protein